MGKADHLLAQIPAYPQMSPVSPLGGWGGEVERMSLSPSVSSTLQIEAPHCTQGAVLDVCAGENSYFTIPRGRSSKSRI